MDELTRFKIKNAELEAALAASERALARAREDLAQQTQEMEALRHFDRELTRGEDLDFVLNYVLNWAKSRTKADYAMIARWDEHREEFEALAAIGFPLEHDYRSGDVIELPEAVTPSLEPRTEHSPVLLDAARTTMVSELRHATGNLIGILMVQRHSGIEFNEAERQFMLTIANRLATSMHMSMLLRKVEQLSQNRKQLFRMLSHDLRQPLTVLMGYIQLIDFALKSNKPIPLEEYISYVLSGSRDLAQLLEEVLMMERAADSSRDEWEKVSMRRICEQAIEKNNPLIGLNEHEFIINLPNEEAYCVGTALELKEAVSNLINNAIKYTPKGGRVEVDLYKREDRWYVEVADTGFGIDKERQSKLFEAFFRAQQPGTEDIKGTGLGLNLVKTIVEKHDGKIFFESVAGQGSMFGFWLPAYKEDSRMRTGRTGRLSS